MGEPEIRFRRCVRPHKRDEAADRQRQIMLEAEADERAGPAAGSDRERKMGEGMSSHDVLRL
jgi:hypothetical protein